MTLKEFLEYREHRFDGKIPDEHSWYYNGYADGWQHAIKDIITVLERHDVDLEIPLK